MSETGKEIIVHAEVPGMDAKDIDISLNGRLEGAPFEKLRVYANKELTNIKISSLLITELMEKLLFSQH